LGVTVLNTPGVTVINPASMPVPVEIKNAPAAARSHMNAAIADHVMLNWVSPGTATSSGGTNAEFRRYLPDGSFASAPFVVPAGRTFVVTDADAVIVAGAGQTFRDGSVVQAVVTLPEHFNSSLVPHASNGVSIATANLGAVAISSSLGAGMIVAAGKQVCIRGDERSASSGFIDRRVATGVIRGYLY
jgi:hypothetical protein